MTATEWTEWLSSVSIIPVLWGAVFAFAVLALFSVPLIASGRAARHG
jgi:hypothetical protein